MAHPYSTFPDICKEDTGNFSTPTTAVQDDGWPDGSIPAAKHFNWFAHWCSKWTNYLAGIVPDDLLTQLSTLAADIATNVSDIATNASAIATNASDIATNAGNISTNTSDIATNAGNIATNTSDIATNASAIAANASDIASNTSDIATNTADISSNDSDIATNAGNIATNTSAISALDSTVSGHTISIGDNYDWIYNLYSKGVEPKQYSFSDVYLSSSGVTPAQVTCSAITFGKMVLFRWQSTTISVSGSNSTNTVYFDKTTSDWPAWMVPLSTTILPIVVYQDNRVAPGAISLPAIVTHTNAASSMYLYIPMHYTDILTTFHEYDNTHQRGTAGVVGGSVWFESAIDFSGMP